jgi:hypothetical protein
MRLLDEQYTRTPFYGSRKMTEWLATEGHEVNRKRVLSLLTRPGPLCSSEMAHLRGWFCRSSPQCIGFRRQAGTEPGERLRDEAGGISIRWQSVDADQREALRRLKCHGLWFSS